MKRPFATQVAIYTEAQRVEAKATDKDIPRDEWVWVPAVIDLSSIVMVYRDPDDDDASVIIDTNATRWNIKSNFHKISQLLYSV